MATSVSTTIEVERREARGTNASGRLRREGRVPGNVYGLGLDPFAVSVSARRIAEVLKLSTGRNTVLTLAMAGADQKRSVMMREMQRDPISGKVIHVDFVRIDASKPVIVRVPVRLVGTADGVKNEGGVLDFIHRELEVSCLPDRIPEQIEVDVSPLKINQNFSVAELDMGEGVTMLDDPETLIVVCAHSRAEVAPVTEEEEAEAALAEGEEPEVAKKGKDEDEGKESD